MLPSGEQGFGRAGHPLGRTVEQGSTAGVQMGGAGLEGLNVGIGCFSVLSTCHGHLVSYRAGSRRRLSQLLMQKSQ